MDSSLLRNFKFLAKKIFEGVLVITMKINPINRTNFGAKFLNNAEVQKYNPTEKRYLPENASIVELECTNPKDVSAISEGVKKWKNDIFGGCVAISMREESRNPLIESNNRFYAITDKKENVAHLKPEDILGVAMVKKNSKRQMQENNEGDLHITYLQINPKYTYKENVKHPRGFKALGEALIRFVASICRDKTTLESGYWCTKFYERLGGELIDAEARKYMFSHLKK